MAFIDDLALELFTIALIGVVSLFTISKIFLNYRKGDTDVEGILKQGAVPLAILGGIVTIMGIYGEMTWPLPGSYNILFYDPYLILGTVDLMIVASIFLGYRLQYSGIVAMFAGFIAIYYGISAYIQQMTSSPLAMLGLYTAFGATGILTFPVTVIYDMLPGRKKASTLWTVVLVLFWIALFASAVLASMTAILADPKHMLHPP